MRNSAFTLAEVLITLVIIGVIAAMTIPTLMGNTNDQEIKSKFKKAISAVSQAAALDYALYGTQFNGDTMRIVSALKNHMSVIENNVYDDPTIFKTADGILYDVGLDEDSCGLLVGLNGHKNTNEDEGGLYRVTFENCGRIVKPVTDRGRELLYN